MLLSQVSLGNSLTVPGDFITNGCSDSTQTVNTQLQQLCDQVRSNIHTPTSQHRAVPALVPHNLQEAKSVFIRRGARHTPFQRPYVGPFKVIRPGPKTFQVDIGERRETVSVI